MLTSWQPSIALFLTYESCDTLPEVPNPRQSSQAPQEHAGFEYGALGSWMWWIPDQAPLLQSQILVIYVIYIDSCNIYLSCSCISAQSEFHSFNSANVSMMCTIVMPCPDGRRYGSEVKRPAVAHKSRRILKESLQPFSPTVFGLDHAAPAGMLTCDWKAKRLSRNRTASHQLQACWCHVSQWLQKSIQSITYCNCVCKSDPWRLEEARWHF